VDGSNDKSALNKKMPFDDLLMKKLVLSPHPLKNQTIQ
jgi:hypothetical protein